jgi:hypothetical protein
MSYPVFEDITTSNRTGYTNHDCNNNTYNINIQKEQLPISKSLMNPNISNKITVSDVPNNCYFIVN